MRRVIFNRKGGVGKSSITVNLAAISADLGLKTLVVDLDTQGNATHYLMGSKELAEGIESRNSVLTIGDWYAQTLSFKLLAEKPEAFVHQTPFENLFLMPASEYLSDLHHQLESKHKIYKLRDFLRSLSGFDAIYIDTPPAFNFYTLSALIAANACLIPFDCDAFSRQAVYSLLGNLKETQMDHNPGLTLEGIVVNQFQPRASLPQQLVDDLLAEQLPVLESKIPASVKMRESHHLTKPLIQFARRHKLTQAFVDLFFELHPHLSPAKVEKAVFQGSYET